MTFGVCLDDEAQKGVLDLLIITDRHHEVGEAFDLLVAAGQDVVRVVRALDDPEVAGEQCHFLVGVHDAAIIVEGELANATRTPVELSVTANRIL